jgi:hypothetical protein
MAVPGGQRLVFTLFVSMLFPKEALLRCSYVLAVSMVCWRCGDRQLQICRLQALASTVDCSAVCNVSDHELDAFSSLLHDNGRSREAIWRCCTLRAELSVGRSVFTKSRMSRSRTLHNPFAAASTRIRI